MEESEEKELDRKNKKMMLTIIGLLVGLLVVIVVVALILLKTVKHTDSNNNSNSVISSNISIGSLSIVSLTSPISTNLLQGEDNKERAINFSLSLGIANTEKESEDIIKLVKDGEPIVRDVVLSILREKTYQELSKVGAGDLLKNEILTKLQDAFGTNLIVKVYLDDFYMI